MNARLLCIISGLALVAATAAQAAKLPDYYPENFILSGQLNRIDPSRDIIVIGDLQLALPGNVKVHTLNTEFGTVNSLRPGMKVGATFATRPGSAPAVSEIWVLPPDYKMHFPPRPPRRPQ
ncbi:MAG TPA: hypothetical protein ENK48_00400 [Gammaproteobacteria bacterium]|nr:hypothetical protein [Gammaproteobacteria bacterium]